MWKIPVLIFALILSSCFAHGGKEAPKNVVVAVVNGTDIKGDLFLAEYETFKKRVKVSDTGNEDVERKMRDGVLETIIQNELIAQEADKAGITVSKEMVDDAVAGMLGGLPEQNLKEMLRKQNRTVEEWRDSVKRNLLTEKLLTAKIAKTITVDEQQIKDNYEKRREEFRKPARARVLHILAANEEDARKARESIVSGTDFAEVARKFSKSPEAEQGGDLGTVVEGQMPKEMDEVIFGLKEGELSPVVKSQYGFHIIKVVGYERPGILPYQDAREKIYNSLFQERLEKKFEEWMKETRKNARVTVHTEKLYGL